MEGIGGAVLINPPIDYSALDCAKASPRAL
jgi:hypothetical protein